MTKRTFRLIKDTASILIIGGLVFSTAYYYRKYDNLLNTTPEGVAQRSQEYAADVAKLFNVPEGEEPRVAEIQDVEALKSDPFFDNAQNGDQLLVYQDAKIAVIYRPNTKKIINSGPISLDEDSADPTAPGEISTKPAAITIAAATEDSANTFRQSNLEALGDAEISAQEYASSTAGIYLLNESFADLVASVAESSGLEVYTEADLPAEITTQDIDILIILAE